MVQVILSGYSMVMSGSGTSTSYTVIALYHFFDFPRYTECREAIKSEFLRLGIKGTLLLTPEGINGTLSGAENSMKDMVRYLERHVVGDSFDYKVSYCARQPFARTKVKIKKETISIGEPAPLQQRGRYVTAQEWNALIADPETIVIDTRNAYEVEMGTFERARNPGIRHFKQLPAYVRNTLAQEKQAKIATFCTGGIRCEKFTAWLAHQGYENVYHLKGGILQYLEETPPAQSKWQGECFVFDERVAVDHTLAPSAK